MQYVLYDDGGFPPEFCRSEMQARMTTRNGLSKRVPEQARLSAESRRFCGVSKNQRVVTRGRPATKKQPVRRLRRTAGLHLGDRLGWLQERPPRFTGGPQASALPPDAA
jgi:hypothetical protein